MKTISYSNRLYLNELESQIIQQDIHLYHQMLIRSYRLIYHKNYNGLQIDSLQKKVKSFYGTNDYLPLSAIHEAKALFKSSRSSHQLHLKKLDKQMGRIVQKVNKTSKEIEKIEKQIQQLIHKTRQYGLSIHQGAAMIIARRSRGYQERIPRECQYFASSWKQMKRVFNKAQPTEHPLLSLIQ